MNTIKYISHFEYAQLWKSIEQTRQYVSYTYAEGNSKMPSEIMVYEGGGIVIYKPREMTKLEKVLK